MLARQDHAVRGSAAIPAPELRAAVPPTVPEPPIGPAPDGAVRRSASRAAHAVAGYAELLRTVQEAGLMRRRRGYYWVRFSAALLALAGVWVGFGLLGDSWFQLLVAAGLAVVLTQFGFLGHDTAHRQFFASPRRNEWATRLISGFITGLGYSWWMSKHSRHHGAPNQEVKDPDIGDGLVAFTPEFAAGKKGLAGWAVRSQGYWFFPLLLLEGLNLHVSEHPAPDRAGAAARRSAGTAGWI